MAAAKPGNIAAAPLAWWLASFVWMGLIFRASSMAGEDIPLLFAYQDVLFHAAIYAILGLFLYRAFAGSFSRARRKQLILIATACAALYGISDEFHQSFVPGRFATASDVMIDLVGAWLGALAGGMNPSWLPSQRSRR